MRTSAAVHDGGPASATVRLAAEVLDRHTGAERSVALSAEQMIRVVRLAAVAEAA